MIMIGLGGESLAACEADEMQEKESYNWDLDLLQAHSTRIPKYVQIHFF